MSEEYTHVATVATYSVLSKVILKATGSGWATPDGRSWSSDEPDCNRASSKLDFDTIVEATHEDRLRYYLEQKDKALQERSKFWEQRDKFKEILQQKQNELEEADDKMIEAHQKVVEYAAQVAGDQDDQE